MSEKSFKIKLKNHFIIWQLDIFVDQSIFVLCAKLFPIHSFYFFDILVFALMSKARENLPYSRNCLFHFMMNFSTDCPDHYEVSLFWVDIMTL